MKDLPLGRLRGSPGRATIGNSFLTGKLWLSEIVLDSGGKGLVVVEGRLRVQILRGWAAGPRNRLPTGTSAERPMRRTILTVATIVVTGAIGLGFWLMRTNRNDEVASAAAAPPAAAQVDVEEEAPGGEDPILADPLGAQKRLIEAFLRTWPETKARVLALPLEERRSVIRDWIKPIETERKHLMSHLVKYYCDCSRSEEDDLIDVGRHDLTCTYYNVALPLSQHLSGEIRPAIKALYNEVGL